MVINVDCIRSAYDRTEDRLYSLRCTYGYNAAHNRVLRKLEERAKRLHRILRHMEGVWGVR
ncbi:MAG TPA: hypothetical protein GXX29_11830 [Firmicutes bacterium]|nr:hypothetical protein [Bacillota bacterium]